MATKRVMAGTKQAYSIGRHRALPRYIVGLIAVVLTLSGVGAATVPGIVRAAATPVGTIAPQPARHDAPTPTTAATPYPTATTAATAMATATATAVLAPRAVKPHDDGIMPQPPTHPAGLSPSGMVVSQPMSHPVTSKPGIVTPQPPRHDLPASPHFARGVNLPAPSFNSPAFVPGVYDKNYTYPTGNDLDYFQSKGLTLFRLPFSWERMQRAQFGALDAEQLGYMDTFIAAAHARNVQVILDVQAFDRYYNVLIGTNAVPNSAFADFWGKLAAHYATETAITGYDLSNEPHDTGGLWPATAQAATNAIRLVDHTHTIIVEGDNYAAGSTWTTYNETLAITDPDNNLVYSAHVYFDADGSGQYVNSYDGEGAYPTVGVDRAQPFVDWLNRHHVRGYVGEYGVPNNDARWLTALDNFLTYLDTNALDGTYWAGGPFLDGYPLSVNPDAMGHDAPQMAILTQHLGR